VTPPGLAPDPASTPDAVIQVYAARAVGWRGVFAVHTWIAVKPSRAARCSRYEVLGFGVANRAPAVRIDRTGPDNYGFGARPGLVLDRRESDCDAMIQKIRDAVVSYPYPQHYRAWPGPNSTTCTACIARWVPELGLALPANAIGKNFLPGGAVFGTVPSGTGFQVSLFGIVGLLVAASEGLEINLLGVTVGFDFKTPALKLPAIGDLGIGT